MSWAVNPVLESWSPTQDDDSATPDVETAPGNNDNRKKSEDTDATPGPPKKARRRLRPPSDHLTLHQFFYIYILAGLGAAVIAGGINFAVAYALYHDKGSAVSPIRLFQFPNTLAGDAAVTVFIQFISTWLVESVRVNRDLRNGGVQPIGFVAEPRWKCLRWYMFLDRTLQTDEVGSPMHWLRFLFSQVVRSLLLVLVSFPFIFGACVGLLTVVGRHDGADWDWYFASTWAPEIFKLVQGALLGLLFTPPMVGFWLVVCGWGWKRMVERETTTTATATATATVAGTGTGTTYVPPE